MLPPAQWREDFFRELVTRLGKIASEVVTR